MRRSRSLLPTPLPLLLPLPTKGFGNSPQHKRNVSHPFSRCTSRESNTYLTSPIQAVTYRAFFSEFFKKKPTRGPPNYQEPLPRLQDYQLLGQNNQSHAIPQGTYGAPHLVTFVQWPNWSKKFFGWEPPILTPFEHCFT
ncbi:hypothetical protein B0H12DRAFT_1124362 [Mycena haematopus]|nr:hypothetical protein B0H12DRAFT_1124362 [Mycena haematopus]